MFPRIIRHTDPETKKDLKRGSIVRLNKFLDNDDERRVIIKCSMIYAYCTDYTIKEEIDIIFNALRVTPQVAEF